MRGEFVDVGGVRVYCYAAGERGRGVPVVLVHDVFGSSHAWHDFVPLLPDGHRVLVADLAGHGRSDPPLAVVAGQLSVRAHAARLTALLDRLTVGRSVLVGHGAGAAIAAVAAARAPERVAGLTLVAPTFLTDAPRPFRRLARLVPLWQRLPAGWVASSLHVTTVRGYAQRDRGARSADVVLRPVRGLESTGRETACAQLRAVAAADAVLPRADLEAIGASLLAHDVRVTLIAGSADPWCPPSAVRAMAQALHADAITVEGARHALPEEHPDAVLEAIVRTLDGIPTRETPTYSPSIPA
ncbi:MAG: alpha/beta hydrolase [Gemmatimonadaceae bacterium]|nr:alpha/beta hydrolase [Gemmatimonadaceae bacterium]